VLGYRTGFRRSDGVAFSYNGTLIDLRVTIHESESSARGAVRFRHLTVNGDCGDALIASAAGSTDVTRMTTIETAYGSVIRRDFTSQGTPFEATSGAFHQGEVTVRYSVIGQGDTSMVADQVFEAVDNAFTIVP